MNPGQGFSRSAPSRIQAGTSCSACSTPPDIKVIIAFDGTLADIGKASYNRASQHGSPAAGFPASPSLTSSARKSVNGPMSWRTLASSRAAM